MELARWRHLSDHSAASGAICEKSQSVDMPSDDYLLSLGAVRHCWDAPVASLFVFLIPVAKSLP